MRKVCTKCGAEKLLKEFGQKAIVKSGLQGRCKACEKEACRWWRARNLAKAKASVTAWHRANLVKHRKQIAAYNSANPAKCRAGRKRYEAKKLQAMPAWANSFFIEEAYALAQLRTIATGFQWHVDHVVPLQHKLVCGLHWEQNFQVIPGRDNISKGNRYWPDMPEQVGSI